MDIKTVAETYADNVCSEVMKGLSDEQLSVVRFWLRESYISGHELSLTTENK